MIVPDINLLVYAYSEEAPLHAAARHWWEGLVNGHERIGLPWIVVAGFVRLMTHSDHGATGDAFRCPRLRW